MGNIKKSLFVFTILFSFCLTAFPVKKVEVEGTVRTEKSIVKNPFFKKEIDEKTIDSILKKLYEKKLFDNITVFYDKNSQTLLVKVVERFMVSKVEFQGYDNVDLEDIKKVVNIKENELFNQEKANKNVDKIIDLYKEKGYLGAQVFTKIEKNEKTKELKIVFYIKEGEKSKLKKITISGNKFLSDKFLTERLPTQADTIFSVLSDNGIKSEQLEQDRAIINYLYLDAGFAEVKVSKPEATISPDKRELYINFNVVEGARFKTDKITVTGDKLENGKYPDSKNFLMKKGEWYKHSFLFKDIETIKRKYGDEGYPFVTVVPERQIDAKKKTISFIYHVQKGNKCNVGRIEIVGNKSSKDKVIRRELRLYEGELYTYSGQKLSEIRLKRTGFYDEAKITLKQGDKKNLVNVLVTVKERKSGTFNIGAGYSSFDGIQFNAKIQQSNFLGYGQTISFQGQASKIRKELSLSIYEPYFMDYNVSLNTSAYFRHYAYDSSYYGYYADYSQDSYGFGLIWGIPLGEYFNVYFGYKLDQVSIGGAAKKQMAYLFRDMFTSALQFMVAFDSRNDRMFPTNGIYTMLSTEIDPVFMGSDENFLKISYNFRFYHPIIWKFVYRVNLDLGWNRQLDNQELPYSERFKLGGVFSLRGYPYSSIGGEPIGVSDNGASPVSRLHPYIIGGDKKVVINNEIEVPLIEKMRLKFVTFLDIGNAYSENENFFYLDGKGTNKYDLPLGMFWSAGFGIRWITGIAPLSFEWGFPLTPRPDDPKFMFEFNFKNSF